MTNLQSYAEKLAYHRKNRRLPILAYIYKSSFNKSPTPVWISSGY